MTTEPKNNNYMPPEELKLFLASLLSKKGGDNLPPEIQARALADLMTRFNDFLLLNATNAMNPEQQDEFERVVAKNSPDEIMQYLRQNIEFTQVLDQTCAEFRDTFLRK